METNPAEHDTDGSEYFVLPEEAIQFLPPEWRDALLELVADGRAVLEAVDSDIKSVIRLVGAFPTMTSLRYVHHRLAIADFKPTAEAILEHDMLTTAFVVTYVRLIDGGIGSGVSRKALPAHLRKAHDEIIELRNKRFAHNVGHESVEGMLEIGFENGRFDLRAAFQLGYYIRGANEWRELVAFLDQLMFERLEKHLAKLRQKTGREWSFPSGPPPPWAGT